MIGDMQSVVMLMMAGIRKSKKQLLSQLIIIFFASMLFNLGLLTAVNFGNYFDEKAEELNSAHVAFAFSNRRYDESNLRWFQNREDVTAIQKDEILILSANLKMPAGNVTNLVFGLDYDDMGDMSQIKLVGPSLALDSRSVYVPYVFQFSGGLQLGSTLTIGLNEDMYDKSKEMEYDFTVAGFTEDVMLGVTNTGAVGIYFPHDVYKSFAARLPDYYKGTLISAQFLDPDISTDVMDEFISDKLNGEDISTWGMSMPIAKYARTATSNILAAVIVAFSIIILLVSLIVIRFRISNTIEEDMRNYGAMKALGYTSIQIIASIVLQFILTTAIACAGGIGCSYIAVTAMSQLLATQTGLNWVQGFDTLLSGVCLVFIVMAAALTAFFSSVKLRRMPPIEALRGGANTNTIRWNVFPLESTGLPLTPVLAVKTTVLNIKQNILIVIILAGVSFAVVFSVVLSYNAPRDTFINMLIGQYADLSITVNRKEDAHEIVDGIRKMDGVVKATVCETQAVIYDDAFINVTVYPDYADILNDQTYRGRNPSHSHEIVISGMLGEMKGKDIGDTIILSLQGREEEYIITGFFQSTNNMGRESLMTTEGFRLLEPNYKEGVIGVKITKDTDIYGFIGELEQRYGERLADIFNLQELLTSQLAAILNMINGLGAIIELITVMIVAFILNLVVRTLVIRRKQDLGIQKALGFTTFQLMNQIAGSFVPVAVLGTGAGGAVGCITMNTCIGFLFRSMGIMKVDFIIPASEVAIVIILLCLLTYVVSLLVSVRIGKISAYALITE